jgi:type IV secretion system protein VirD4
MDPKAELANITAERRAALGQKVIVLDPFNHAAGRLAPYRKAYNPLAVLKPENPTIIEDAGLIADALVVMAADARDPHWDESAKNFIEGLILETVSNPLFNGRRTLITVRDLIKQALSKIPSDLDEDDKDDDGPRFVIKEQMLKNAARLQQDRSRRGDRRRGA